MTIVERALEFVSTAEGGNWLQAIVDAIGGVGSMRIERRAGATDYSVREQIAQR